MNKYMQLDTMSNFIYCKTRVGRFAQHFYFFKHMESH